jgi:hypothetical protein
MATPLGSETVRAHFCEPKAQMRRSLSQTPHFQSTRFRPICGRRCSSPRASMCAREADYRPIGRGLRAKLREPRRSASLVAQAAPYDHDGGDDHRDEQEPPDRRRDHRGTDPAAEHRRELLRQRDLVHQRVTPDGEDDVREHEVERRVGVPAVPDAEPIEADEPLEPGQPGEQEHLDQRRVGGEQPR